MIFFQAIGIDSIVVLCAQPTRRNAPTQATADIALAVHA
jgi:hypothetical protein